jgi:hypothetical protein
MLAKSGKFCRVWVRPTVYLTGPGDAQANLDTSATALWDKTRVNINKTNKPCLILARGALSTEKSNIMTGQLRWSQIWRLWRAWNWEYWWCSLLGWKSNASVWHTAHRILILRGWITSHVFLDKRGPKSAPAGTLKGSRNGFPDKM